MQASTYYNRPHLHIIRREYLFKFVHGYCCFRRAWISYPMNIYSRFGVYRSLFSIDTSCTKFCVNIDCMSLIEVKHYNNLQSRILVTRGRIRKADIINRSLSLRSNLMEYLSELFYPSNYSRNPHFLAHLSNKNPPTQNASGGGLNWESPSHWKCPT